MAVMYMYIPISIVRSTVTILNKKLHYKLHIDYFFIDPIIPLPIITFSFSISQTIHVIIVIIVYDTLFFTLTINNLYKLIQSHPLTY